MRTRRLGQTDLELTTIGLGAWAIGGPWLLGWGPQDDEESIRTILAAIDRGINWIDTAPIYGHGHSEQIVGKALKQTSEKPFIATKCGLIWDKNSERICCLKKESIRKECEQSLKRLGADVIDLYQIHWNQPPEDIEQAWEELTRLKEQGKVRNIGVSNFNVSQLKLIGKIHPVASVQPPYSMLRRDIEEDILPYCAKNNIGVIVYSPMQKGLLTGKFDKKRIADLPESDHRRNDRQFHEPNLSATLDLVEKLRTIAGRNSITVAQLALAWVLRRPEVTAAIAGARKPQQIEETAAASEITLSEDDLQEIEELLARRNERIKT
ncbi:MAG: aldo/keto reductase [Phycisphaerae bacterium]